MRRLDRPTTGRGPIPTDQQRNNPAAPLRSRRRAQRAIWCQSITETRRGTLYRPAADACRNSPTFKQKKSARGHHRRSYSCVNNRWAVAHKPRCRVRKFEPKCKWKMTFLTKSFRCHKTRNIHLLRRVEVCTSNLRIFTALHGMQTRSGDENSVCPSVCLSNAWIMTNGRKICPDCYTIRKII